MGFPKIKRVNTIGIRYTKGERDESHYEEIIEHILKVSVDGIAGICEWGPKRFILKVSTSNTYLRISNDFVGKTMKIDNDNEFEVDDMSTYKNRVRVTKVPFEMHIEDLKSLLERY